MGDTWLKGSWDSSSVNSSPWKTYGKLGSFVGKPGPSSTWVLIDEHPDSINDEVFCVAMGATANAPSDLLVDTPASYHNGACGISFADGHAEIHKWHGNAIQIPVINGNPNNNNYANGHHMGGTDSLGDLQWLQSVTTGPR